MTVDQLARQAERLEDPAAHAHAEAAQASIADYDAKLARYRARIDAGGDLNGRQPQDRRHRSMRKRFVSDRAT